MIYKLQQTTQFKKDCKLLRKRGYNLEELQTVLELLQTGQPLAEKHRDHELVGNLRGFRECHITPDWLLIYEIYQNELLLYLTRTGSHSDVF